MLYDVEFRRIFNVQSQQTNHTATCSGVFAKSVHLLTSRGLFTCVYWLHYDTNVCVYIASGRGVFSQHIFCKQTAKLLGKNTNPEKKQVQLSK